MEPNMSQQNDQSVTRSGRRQRSVFGMLTAVLLVGGCSAVPDWADPTDWFASDVAPTKVGLAEGQARSQPTAFPNLASVPNQPPKILSLEARAEVQASLAADHANAVYSGEKLTGSAPILATASQTVSGASLGAPAAPKISDELTAELRVPPAPVQTPVAQTQVAQTQVAPAAAPQIPAPQIPAPQIPAVQTQIAQASGGRTQLRFPQFQNLQRQAGAAPAIAAVPSAAGVQLVAVIYFGHSSSRLDGADRAVLRDVVTLGRQRGATIRVVGHASAHTTVTDQITHDLTNFEMSLKRANSVAAELIALGADRDQVRAEARSDKQPIYHEFMTTGQAGNRRVEIFLEF
jgi:outer membrane protein OmpA-like peptidoglycan-associated protein